jgi:hypothetical protein
MWKLYFVVERDRVAQAAAKLVLEPIFATGRLSEMSGDRPFRTGHR